VNCIVSYLLQCCDVKQRLTSGWVNEKTHEWLGPTIGCVNGLFLRERTKTSRNETISFSQSPERATATRGRVQLVLYMIMFSQLYTQVWRPLKTDIELSASCCKYPSASTDLTRIASVFRYSGLVTERKVRFLKITEKVIYIIRK
jgi:hypothetical protein